MIFYRLLSILSMDKLFFFVTSISIDFWYQSIWIGGLYRLISMTSIDSRYRSGLINSVEQHLMFSDRNVNRSNEMVEKAVVYQQCGSYPWRTLYVSRVSSLALWDFSFRYSGFHSSRKTRTLVDFEKTIIFLRDSRASNKRARVKIAPREETSCFSLRAAIFYVRWRTSLL